MSTPPAALPSVRRVRFAPWRWVRSVFNAWVCNSLGVRIVILFLGLLLAVQAGSFFAIRSSIDRNARASVGEDLQVAERMLQRVLTQNAHKLGDAARVLVTDAGFLSAVGRNDPDTLRAVLAHHGQRIGAHVAALLDTRHQLRASTDDEARALQPLLTQLAAGEAQGRDRSGITVLRGRPFQYVLSPLHTPLLAGWVLLGFPIEQGLVDDLREISGLDLHLQLRPQARAPWQTAASTLTAPARRVVDDALSAVPLLSDEAQALTLRLDEGEFSARVVSLSGARADDAEVSAVLLRSLDDAAAPYRPLQLVLAALTLLGVFVFALGSVMTARHVTAPLRRLAAAAERLRAGDYRTPLLGQHRRDEIGELSQSFERMRKSIAQQQQEILHLAYWDALTGLPNRVQFRNAVQEAIERARPQGRSVSVVMLDLDRFKHVNDVLGYRFGDLLLKQVAARLSQQAVRAGDIVARLDGDEFAVLLADLDPANDLALTQQVAQRIAMALDGPMQLDEHTVDTSAAIGMASCPQQAQDADALLGRAEVAMYTAKRRGDGPMLYDPQLDATSTQTLTLLGELRHAVDHQELRLFLQPRLSLATGAVVGAEALVRWEHPQRGLVPPMQFIPFAEQTGFIRVLTQWVFGEAARVSRLLEDGGVPIVTSVNLSTRDLLDNDLPHKFDQLLNKHGVPAERFCLEITESAIMDDPQRALVTLERLSAIGFRLAIDDFGTGYSSLAYLKRLPVDELKIDKSFVMNMEKDADDARIVRSTIDLAHGLGLSVVAEGVESAQAWDLLRDLSCDEAQGYHMGKPMPAHEFTRWCSGWTAQHAVRLASTGGAVDPDAVVLH